MSTLITSRSAINRPGLTELCEGCGCERPTAFLTEGFCWTCAGELGLLVQCGCCGETVPREDAKTLAGGDALCQTCAEAL